eukprot:1162090-Pelagomonas_calceolata.AAC.4
MDMLVHVLSQVGTPRLSICSPITVNAKQRNNMVAQCMNACICKHDYAGCFPILERPAGRLRPHRCSRETEKHTWLYTCMHAYMHILTQGTPPFRSALLVDSGPIAADGGEALRKGARNLPW